jgi:hypothetical protein
MHCLIGFDQDARALQSLGPLPRQVTRHYFGFRCDSDLAQFTALRAGVGIGGCQHIIARDFRELVPVLAKAIRFELEVWIAMHEDMKSTTRVRMLFDHLAPVHGVNADRDETAKKKGAEAPFFPVPQVPVTPIRLPTTVVTMPVVPAMPVSPAMVPTPTAIIMRMVVAVTIAMGVGRLVPASAPCVANVSGLLDVGSLRGLGRNGDRHRRRCCAGKCHAA